MVAARSKSSRLFLLALLLGVACAVPAQQYPSKPVRIIVGAAPGGGTDFVSRLMAAKLTELVGQQVFVENRSGAGSTIGYEYGVRAAPDGYTLTMITGSWSINPSLYPLKFNALTDYTPIVWVARGPYVIVVHPSLPVKTTRELVSLAKAHPGQITYGSSGLGAIVHLTTALFEYKAGIKMTHIPYKGGGPAMTDLLAGNIQLLFATSPVGLPQVKAGRLRALAVTTPDRLAAEPKIPTVAESGVPGYEVTNWHGLIGPKGLPRPVVERLNSEMNKILTQKEMGERLETEGLAAAGGTPERLYEQVKKELELWHDVVTRAGIKIN
ncbi:MAG TPA: tripartite tricarboxylate transporter substrate binding protein [Burkholderiales bacterium]|nr:tripartite tricarboxylate transporter substrate binding protein [Burkholderiales bacterium]